MALRLNQIVGGLDEFLNEYGKLLGRKASDTLAPLHVPGQTDTVPISIFSAERPPFDPQLHVISAAVAVAAQMGTPAGHHHRRGDGHRQDPDRHVHPPRPRPPERPGRRLPGPGLLPQPPDRQVGQGDRAGHPRRKVTTFDRSQRVGRNGELVDATDADDSWKDVIRYYAEKRDDDRTPAQEVARGARWRKPDGPEFAIIGQNQSKFDPDWRAIAADKELGWHVYRRITFRPKTAHREADRRWVICCPRCGGVIRNGDGDPIKLKELEHEKDYAYCNNLVLQEVPEPDDPKAKPSGRLAHEGLDRRPISKADPITLDYANRKPGTVVRVPIAGFSYERRVPRHRLESGEGDPAWRVDEDGDIWETVKVPKSSRLYRVEFCNEPLWTWTSKPHRWAPARFLKTKCRGLFDTFILDEMHEEKSDSSAQSMAAGKLMAVCDKIIGLTGTLIGGYAHHLLPLLMRMAPDALRPRASAGGRTSGSPSSTAGSRRSSPASPTARSCGPARRPGGRSRCGRRASRTKTDERIAPGIMPQILGDILIGNTIFIGLGDMARNLPPINGNGQGEPIPVDMDPELDVAYGFVAGILEETVKKMMQLGSMKLLGAMLQTTLDYPDKPFGWEPPPGCEGKPAIGFWDNDNDEDEGDERHRPNEWVGVVQPPDLDPMVMRNKERALVDLCLREKAEGRQVWVYLNMTGAKRDIQPRLAAFLQAAGLKVGILRSTSVEPRDREKWIIANGHRYDVVLSHPKLVSTGLDLFDKGGRFNYATLVFYETGYDLNLFRQASRRSWRIGQKKECRLFYLYYRGTMQERALALMGKKLAAAQNLEGKFSTEGLAAMAGDDNAAMALAKSLAEKIEPADRAWKKIGEEPEISVLTLVKAGRFDAIPDLADLDDAQRVEVAEMLTMLAEGETDPAKLENLMRLCIAQVKRGGRRRRR